MVGPSVKTTKAEDLSYHPQVIQAERRINNAMGAYVAQHMIKQLKPGGSAHQGRTDTAWWDVGGCEVSTRSPKDIWWLESLELVMRVYGASRRQQVI